MAAVRQLAFELPTWGGARTGSGRKSSCDRPARPHRAREEFSGWRPVHVTIRMTSWVWNLRSQRSFAVIQGVLWGVADRSDFRMVHFSIQGNHLHFVVDANGSRAPAAGMRALSIRLARRLNVMMERRGRVLEDRYHAHVLRTPAEVRNAVAYVLGNYAGHAARRGEQVPLRAPGGGWRPGALVRRLQ
jgi:putative transposase